MDEAEKQKPSQDGATPSQPPGSEAPQGRPERSSRPLLVAAALIIVACVVTLPTLRDRITVGKQKRTMGDMRTLATAFESYSIDNMQYIVVDPRDVAALDHLAHLLEPTYVKTMPRRDAWGHELHVVGSTSEYTIVSYGRDGSLDGPSMPRPAPNGSTTDPRSDIVFSTGSFVQFPGRYPIED